jgi:hypothetical protein
MYRRVRSTVRLGHIMGNPKVLYIRGRFGSIAAFSQSK